MRVIHIIKVVRVAGAEQHLLTLLAGLRAAQIDARLLLLVEPHIPMDDYVAMLAARDIPVERLSIARHADPTLLSRLRAALRAAQPDIVHTHLIHADLYGTLAARWAGVPVVVSSRHNDDAFRHYLPVKLLLRGLWGMTDAGIGISESITRFSSAVEGASPAKLHTIHYGLPLSQALDRNATRAALLAELRLPNDAVLVSMVCRLVEQKGVFYGLSAVMRLFETFPTLHLLVVGEGPLRADMERRAAAAPGRIHFLGWRDDVPALLRATDVLIAPSLWEGFGLVLLEAMAQQTPIVASAVSAIPEVVIDEETGLLAAPRDVSALSEALRRLLQDAPLRQHMGLLGRDRLETHFSAERMVQATRALYDQVSDTTRK
jgi:glycosyltransferase involved in cell wall biosynthesis